MKSVKKAYLVAMALVAGLSVATLQSCKMGCVHGSGHQISENRKLGDFTKIDIAGDKPATSAIATKYAFFTDFIFLGFCFH